MWFYNHISTITNLKRIQWLAIGWPMAGQWFANGWRMAGQWLANGWSVVKQWSANGEGVVKGCGWEGDCSGGDGVVVMGWLKSSCGWVGGWVRHPLPIMTKRSVVFFKLSIINCLAA